jgi:hypothetical protein
MTMAEGQVEAMQIGRIVSLSESPNERLLPLYEVLD